MYCDMRDDDDKEEDTMDKWDEDKLKEVVEKKHGGGNRPTTDIVSYINNIYDNPIQKIISSSSTGNMK